MSRKGSSSGSPDRVVTRCGGLTGTTHNLCMLPSIPIHFNCSAVKQQLHCKDSKFKEPKKAPTDKSANVDQYMNNKQLITS